MPTTPVDPHTDLHADLHSDVHSDVHSDLHRDRHRDPASLVDLRSRAGVLVGELALVAGLAGVAVVLPWGDGAPRGWDLLAPFFAFWAHLLLGLVVLGDAVVTLVRCARTTVRGAREALVAGVAGVLLAVAGGVGAWTGVPRGVTVTAMVLGWTTATAAYLVVWRLTARTLSGGRGPRHAARGTSAPALPAARGVHRRERDQTSEGVRDAQEGVGAGGELRRADRRPEGAARAARGRRRHGRLAS